MATEIYTSRPQGKIPNSSSRSWFIAMPCLKAEQTRLRHGSAKTGGPTTGTILEYMYTRISTPRPMNVLAVRMDGWSLDSPSVTADRPMYELKKVT